MTKGGFKMARNNSNKLLVPQAYGRINQMKNEIAAEFGMSNYENMDKGELTARQNGSIGGEITKRLVRMAQESMQ
jgi:hypothetical protein